MKTKKMFVACVSMGTLLGLSLPVLTAENSSSGKQRNNTNDTKLIGGVSDGRPTPRVPKKPLPKYQIERTKTHHISGQKIVINRVKKPSEASQRITPAPGAGSSSDPQNKREIKPLGGFFTVEAKIYDHQVTLVRWSHNGEKFEVWSNLDWNHLEGFTTFEGRGKEYHMLLLSGNIQITKLKQERIQGQNVEIPAIPKLPKLSKEGARYMVMKGNEKNDEAMEFIEAVHDLYDAERIRLMRAYHERERNRIIRERKEAALRKNPPPKEDAVINYWRKNSPSGKKGE